MTDERLGLDLARWMKDTEFAPPDASHSARQVATRLPQTRQLGRRWWLPSYRRTQTHPPTTDQTTEYQPRPIPATNGHTPTVIGRTHAMFSPAKAITAGAIVFAVGGAMLIAQPFGQQQGSVPGAATVAEPVTFTASLRPGNDVGSTTLTEMDGRVERRGTVWAPSLTASDPRIEGEVRLSSPQDAYPGPAGPESFTLRTDTWRIENDEGAWQGTTVGFTVTESGLETGSAGTLVLAGEGAYEGLYAVLDLSGSRDMRGVIFPAPPPDAATLASAP